CEEEERETDAAGEVPALQTKLVVGAADDPYEKEADAGARQGMRAPAGQRKGAQGAAEEEHEEAGREVRRGPPARAAPASLGAGAPQLKTLPQPPPAALSVTMEGIFFEPGGGGVYEAGPKAPQLLALALNRLLGSQYRPDLVGAAFAYLDRQGQQRYGGFLAGQTAKAGEPIGRAGFFPTTPLTPLPYPERQRKLKVDLSPEQREILDKGFATANAWGFLQHEAELHKRPLPSWYTPELFFMEMGQQGGFLKEYQDALKLIPQSRQVAENVALL